MSNYSPDTNQASELYELCKEVYKRTGWYDVDNFYVKSFTKKDEYKNSVWEIESYGDYSQHMTKEEFSQSNTIPLYTSDYLLEKLPEELKKQVLVVTNGDRPHAGYAQRDNYGNYTLDEYYWKNAYYSDEVRKSLLKLTIALSEAGELNDQSS